MGDADRRTVQWGTEGWSRAVLRSPQRIQTNLVASNPDRSALSDSIAMVLRDVLLPLQLT